MLKANVKKLIIAMCCATFCVVALAGCGQINKMTDPANAEKAATSVYFAEVNSAVNEFKSTLGDFSADVKEKNVDNMKKKIDESQKLIDQFNKLEVPKNCEDVQKLYLDGFVQMQQALSNYVQIYSDFQSGQIDNNVLNQRVADVQSSYNSGLNLLTQADKLASEK